MTQTSIPWNGTTVGDAGPYADTDWQQLWQNIIGWAGMRANVGPLLGSGTQPNDGLKVQAQSPTAAAVDVLNGAAVAHGVFFLSDATEAFAVSANASGNPRIDTIVVQVDYIAQTARLAILTGTPAASPSAPSLTQTPNVLWEIPLADIAVANGFTVITNANISSRHEWVNAPVGVYLDNVLNNSGSDLTTGAAVIWDSTTDRAVTTTTTPNHILQAGVWVGRTPNAGYGRVLVRGIGLVRTTAALSRGTGLINGATAGQFAGDFTNGAGRVGFMLEASSAGGLALAYVDVQRAGVQIATFAYEVAQNTAGPAYTTGAERTVSVNTELSDLYAIAAVNGSNQIVLEPGRYRFLGHMDVQAASGATRTGWLLLHNVTAGARLLKSNNYFIVSATFVHVELSGVFEITVQSLIEMRVLVTTTGWTQAAMAINSAGETERYTYMEFERLA